MLKGKLRRLAALVRNNRGTAAVSFILCFPIFLMIVAILVQYALVVNGKIMVDYAAYLAARSAATALPDDQPDLVQKAARFALEPLSPECKSGATSEAEQIRDSLSRLGVKLTPTFANRYTYAQEATKVEYPDKDYVHRPAEELEVTVTYRMYLNIPGANTIIASYTGQVAGVNGKFIDLTSRCKIESSHGRKTSVDAKGLPNGADMDGGTGGIPGDGQEWDSGDDLEGWDANGGFDDGGGAYSP